MALDKLANHLYAAVAKGVNIITRLLRYIHANEFRDYGYKVFEVPLEDRCKELVSDPRKGKNMFVLGLLCNLYGLDAGLAREQIARIFGKKDDKVCREWDVLLLKQTRKALSEMIATLEKGL